VVHSASAQPIHTPPMDILIHVHINDPHKMARHGAMPACNSLRQRLLVELAGTGTAVGMAQQIAVKLADPGTADC